MKIALFHNLPAGGAKRALFEHARELHSLGHVMDGYSLDSASENYLPLSPLCRQFYSYPVPDAYSVAMRRLLYHPGMKVLWKIAGKERFDQYYTRYVEANAFLKLDALEALYARMAADIDVRGYDVVYVHHCRFLLAPYLLRALKTPTVYYCQDTLRHLHEWTAEEHPHFDSIVEGPQNRRHKGWVIPEAMLRRLRDEERRDTANARAADCVLANSYYSRESILKACGVNAQVCYLGVDSDFFTPDSSEVSRENTVLSVGSLTVSKRHDFILDAVALIPKAIRPTMKIIGYDPSLNKDGASTVEEALRKRAFEQEVQLVIQKEVTDEVLRDGYRRAAVFAFAPHLEPFGFVPLEAMACGTPVVGVREGGLRESIQDGVTGLLTDRDVREFSSAMEKILTVPSLAEHLQKNGLSNVRTHWTWASSAKKLEIILKSVSMDVKTSKGDVRLSASIPFGTSN